MQEVTDPRIPLVFGEAAAVAPDDAVLAEQASSLACEPPSGSRGAFATFTLQRAEAHAAACACCAPRSSVAEALGRLFLARARGDAGFFRRVVVTCLAPAGEQAVRNAVATDPVAAARFRLS